MLPSSLPYSKLKHPPQSYSGIKIFLILLCIIIALYLLFFIYLHVQMPNTVEKTHSEKSSETSETSSTTSTITTTPVIQNSNNAKWLHILIPTISRQNHEDYLTPTLDSVIIQLEHSSLYTSNNVKIIVLNHNLPENPHLVVENLKKVSKYSKWVDFVDSKPASRDTSNKILQQTKDFLTSIRHIQQNYEGQYLLLMEDDFTLCKNGMRALHYLIDKSTAYFPDWKGLRISYGLNGVILKMSDLPEAIEYYSKIIQNSHTRLSPPDHNMYYFMFSEDPRNAIPTGKPLRELVSFRYNLFRHIGVSSTILSSKTQRYNPKCYQVLYDWLQEFERFRNEDCPLEDISPCSPRAKTRVTAAKAEIIGDGDAQEFDANEFVQFSPQNLIDWDVNSKQLCRLHFPKCPNQVTNEATALEQHCRLG